MITLPVSSYRVRESEWIKKAQTADASYTQDIIKVGGSEKVVDIKGWLGDGRSISFHLPSCFINIMIFQ